MERREQGLANIVNLKGATSQARKRRPYTLSISSGKGGVGKTLTTVNLAIAARRQGHSVLILDGDLGLANVDVVLGLQARYSIKDVLDGTVDLKDVIIDGPMGIKVIPSGSGITSLTNLTYVQQQVLEEQIRNLDLAVDILFIDTGAGISTNVLNLNAAADKTIIVTTCEPHAMTDAYALIKVMAEEKGHKTAHLLVNQTHSAGEGLKVFERISEVARRFLQVSVEYLGHIPSDPQVAKSVMKRQAASEQSTFTIAGQAWNRVAQQIFGQDLAHGVNQLDADGLWQRILWSRIDQNVECQL